MLKSFKFNLKIYLDHMKGLNLFLPQLLGMKYYYFSLVQEYEDALKLYNYDLVAW